MSKTKESNIAKQIAEAIQAAGVPSQPWCGGLIDEGDVGLAFKRVGPVKLPMRSADQPVTIWPATDVRDTESPIRGEYVAAMKQAILRNYVPLIDVHKKFSE